MGERITATVASPVRERPAGKWEDRPELLEAVVREAEVVNNQQPEGRAATAVAVDYLTPRVEAQGVRVERSRPAALAA